MAKRIGLSTCINPTHNDKTPSMAVYDHGKDKLQVFCFGCKYHAWVYPENIEIQERKERGKITPEYTTQYPLKEKYIRDYCEKRNCLEHYKELYEIANPVWEGERPQLSWSIYTWEGQYIGKQVRYLDNKKPKTRYVEGKPDGKYTLYYTSLTEYSNKYPDVIVITESHFDRDWETMY